MSEIIQLEKSWLEVLKKEFDQPYMQELKQFLLAEKSAGKSILPASSLWFNALNSTLPKSLLNINKELLTDLNIDNRHSGYLQPWANQGVILLNAVLSVEEGQSNAHQGRGWEVFTDAVIQAINDYKDNIVFILWGAYAQKKGVHIDRNKHLVIQSPHPSPLSAHRGFFGSQPFSQTNDYLSKMNQASIDWQLP